MSKSLFSYVVRYDSGFAPNPFGKHCTLATCKSEIRESAQVGDWVVGTGSNKKEIRRGDFIVYAMCVTEILSTNEYWCDPRFQDKKPNVNSTWQSASGDNIYELLGNNGWNQLDSYHSLDDGTPNQTHMDRDTKVLRVLVSDNFVYFGGEGPRLPSKFLNNGSCSIVKSGQGHKRERDTKIIDSFERWFDTLEKHGLCGRPYDWIKRTTKY